MLALAKSSASGEGEPSFLGPLLKAISCYSDGVDLSVVAYFAATLLTVEDGTSFGFVLIKSRNTLPETVSNSRTPNPMLASQDIDHHYVTPPSYSLRRTERLQRLS